MIDGIISDLILQILGVICIVITFILFIIWIAKRGELKYIGLLLFFIISFLIIITPLESIVFDYRAFTWIE